MLLSPPRRTTSRSSVELAPLRFDRHGLPVEKRAALSLVILLIDLAKTDGAFSNERECIIHRELITLLGYSALECALLLNSALHQQARTGRAAEAEKIVMETFSISQRRKIFALCWEIIDSSPTTRAAETIVAERLALNAGRGKKRDIA